MFVDTPEMTLGQKLKQLRLDRKNVDKKWTMDYVAQLLSVTSGAISQYETDRNKPSSETLLSIAKIYDVTIDDLLSDDALDVKSKKSDRGLSPLLPTKKIQLYLSQLPEKDAELYIPYYDVEITAGKIELYFDDVYESPEGYIYAPHYRGCIACNVKGDSMYDRIFPGSRLYVYQLPNKKYIDFGQIYLVVLEGYRLLKYIHKHPDDETKVKLVSHNKHYGDWDIDKVDILNLFLVKGYENQNAI
ncbi:XRE family transcriptional regulator [Spirosoma sp. KNUC1025]|uniref:XRE family transcriptional regulator n=1 Tax=Spirosoma sp. KNUC1025 TaxID=2894082 RepID=UPI00386AD5F1|nr:XRE family transcriptional regulator [Spirosoma sp. KNUC1025]